MSRFEMTDLDRMTVDRARKTVDDHKSVGHMGTAEMAGRIGRLEATVEGLIEMIDRAVTE